VTRTLPRALLLGAVVLAGCMNGDDESTPSPPPLTSTEPEPPSDAPRTAFPGDTWNPRVVSACSARLPVPFEQGAGERYYLYFTCLRKRGPPTQAAAARELAEDEAAPKAALRLLLEGPTAAERRAGFYSPFDAKTKALPFSVAVDVDGLAVVDLHRSIMDRPRAFISVTETAQITSTVGQFPDVKLVEIRVGGEPLCRVLGEC
jgi:hypothetical protein